MRKPFAIAALAGGLLLVLTGSGPLEHQPLPAPPAPDRTKVCSVSAVRNATELTIRCGEQEQTVRLAGVYVPSGAARDIARAFLERLLDGEAVYATAAAGRDKAGVSTLVLLYRAPEGLLVNLELVRQGYARAVDPTPFQYVDLFRAYENHARRHAKGIWARDTAPEPVAEAGNPPPRTTSQPATPTAQSTVYVTPHGKKYHRTGCYHLRGGGQPLTRAEAEARGYTPCSRCWPTR